MSELFGRLTIRPNIKNKSPKMRKLLFRRPALPPKWKVKREFDQIKKQYFGFAKPLEHVLFSTLYYDLFLSRRKSVSNGQERITSSIAIYLIFPVNGILESHIVALKYINAAGYTPLVVSNITLSSEDRKKVLKFAWRLIERPNFGYDFGGYRDGMKEIFKQTVSPSRVAILNDSAWFPTHSGGSWLNYAEAQNADFVGAVSNFGTPAPKVAKLQEFEWSYSVKAKNFHYCSFALLFKSSILKDPKFRRFWMWLKLSNDKMRTVMNGEIGLSQFVVNSGFTHTDTFGLKNFPDEVHTMTQTQLLTLLTELLIPDLVDFHQNHIDLLKRGRAHPDEHWEAQAKSFIFSTVAWHGAGFTIPGYKTNTENFPFLKKSLVTFHEDACDIALKVAHRIDARVDFDLDVEINALKRPQVSVEKQKILATD